MNAIKDEICWRIMNGKQISSTERMIVTSHYSVRDKKELEEICENQITRYGNRCDLNWLDVSAITDMSELFKYGTRSFNGDISGWDVTNVADMSYMFINIYNFNRDISAWDVTNVADMCGMFWNAKSFNGDLSGWDVSNVVNMSEMFYYAESFNRNISEWDVSNVCVHLNMFHMCPIARRKKSQPKFKI